MQLKTRMLEGLYVVGGPVVNRRRRSPERRSKTSRSQTAYSTPNTYKNGRPRTTLTSTLSPQGKPSPSSIPSSSIPPTLPNIGGNAAVGHAQNSWAFSVKGLPKEIHSYDTTEQSSGAPFLPLSAPPVHSRRKGVEFVKDATNTQQAQLRTNQSLEQTYGGQLHLDGIPRVKSAPNMSEIQNLNISTVGLTTRSLNGGNMITEQQHTQRNSVPSPSQVFDETKRLDGNRSSDEYQTDAFQPLPQTPRNRLPKTRQSVKPPINNYETKLMRIRSIMDKSPEYDGPIRYSPSELRPSFQAGASGFDKLLIMRQMPRQQRNQRSPRGNESSEENPIAAGKVPVDSPITGGDSNHYVINQRERSMVMELTQLSRKHAAKSVRSTDSKEASRAQTAALQVTSSATVPNEELPKDTLVNDWLDEPDKNKKTIVCNIPNTESTS